MRPMDCLLASRRNARIPRIGEDQRHTRGSHRKPMLSSSDPTPLEGPTIARFHLILLRLYRTIEHHPSAPLSEGSTPLCTESFNHHDASVTLRNDDMAFPAMSELRPPTFLICYKKQSTGIISRVNDTLGTVDPRPLPPARTPPPAMGNPVFALASAVAASHASHGLTQLRPSPAQQTTQTPVAHMNQLRHIHNRIEPYHSKRQERERERGRHHQKTRCAPFPIQRLPRASARVHRA